MVAKSMSFRCDRDESRFLIEAEGSLGIEVAAEFKATLVEAASSGLATHLDIARATSIDASCLQLIWAAANRTSPAIQPLSVVGDLPASTTVAAAVEERLLAAGQPAFLLDGDNLRHDLNGDLGFDEHARTENVRRTAHVARLLAESGTIALVSLVSPYAADRRAAAALHAADDLGFLEIFVDAPLELCEQRDPKGLYARARSGELAGLTGVGAPYEAPAEPDLVLGSFQETVEEEVERVMELLVARGLISG